MCAYTAHAIEKIIRLITVTKIIQQKKFIGTVIIKQ